LRQLIRRLRTCDAGAGVVEYTVLIGLVALGLLGILMLFRSSVGDLTNRTSVSISKRAGGGYTAAGGVGKTPIGRRPGTGDPDTPDPDSTSAHPDSTSAAAHAPSSFRLAAPWR
jgi:Flp pilus assembly pilin Flp